MTLEGLPLPMLILGGGVRLTLNLGRITSDNADPGGGGQKDPSKVIVDPFQVEVILPRSLQILSKLR